MARMPRKYVVDKDEAGVYYCINRCVRRRFLCGTDEVSVKSLITRNRSFRIARSFSWGCSGSTYWRLS